MLNASARLHSLRRALLYMYRLPFIFLSVDAMPRSTSPSLIR